MNNYLEKGFYTERTRCNYIFIYLLKDHALHVVGKYLKSRNFRNFFFPTHEEKRKGFENAKVFRLS
jgi:hypothetical protein